MIDRAGYAMSTGSPAAIERVQGCNDNMTRSHYHQYFEIYYLECGTRYHNAEDQVYYIEAPSMIIFPPYVMHHSYGTKDAGFTRIVAYFCESCVSDERMLADLKESVRSYHFDPAQRAQVDAIMSNLIAAHSRLDAYTHVHLTALVNQLLVTLMRYHTIDATHGENRITQVINFLHHNHQRTITLDELAGRFYISPYHLCREFKKFTGRTITQYVNQIRIGHAQRLLNESDLPIWQISAHVGFSNVTHFNRVFKEITATNPSTHKSAAKQATPRRSAI